MLDAQVKTGKVPLSSQRLPSYSELINKKASTDLNNNNNKLATERFCEAGFAAPQKSGYLSLNNNNGANHLAYCLLIEAG